MNIPEINLNDFQGDVKELSLDALFPAEGEKTPRLRFKGFEGEWQRVCFGDLYEHCIVKNDMTYGLDKIISVANMYYIQDANVSDDDYLRTYNVFKLGDIAFEGNKSKNFAHGRFVENTIGDGIISHVFEVFRPKSENYDLMFWKYAINNEMLMGKILSRCTKASTMMTNLVAQDFLKESILVPSLEEQKKIGSFLQRLDAQMALHKQQYERLQQLKSACLNSMFPNQSENTPPIRFNGYDEDWVVVPLSDCLMVSKERNVNGIYTKNDVLSVSDDFGVVNQIELLGRSFAGKSVTNYRVLKHGDIVYTKSPLKIKPFGIIKVNEGENGIVSTLYAVYTAKEGVLPQFINYYFAPSYRMNSYIHPLVNKGAKNDMKVSDENVLKGNICIPSSLDEQKSIASFFLKLDSHISTELQRLERLKQMKSACLRSMFPQNGGGILPVIRFNGFNGVWITKRFTDIFVFLKNNSLSRAELDLTGTVMNVHYGDILVKFGDLIDMNKETLPYIKNEPLATTLAESCRLQNGDILFADAAEDNTVGKCAEIMSIDNKDVVSGLHTIPCRPGTGMFAEGFLGYCLNAPSFHDQLLPLIQGTKISSISKKALSSTFITYPSDINEQQHIASFFRSLDTKILLQTQRIEKLKQMKVACLNKMIA